MQRPESSNATYIEEINRLWRAVYPLLADHIAEIYGRSDGTVAEIGPFCGVIYDLVPKIIGGDFAIMSFPESITAMYEREVAQRGFLSKIRCINTDPALSGVKDESIDLVIFRGALFFPELFGVNYPAILRVLRDGGVAFIGGGFGKYTPPALIEPIAKRSRELNILLGKKEITPEAIVSDLKAAGITRAEITTDGGIWVILKKNGV
ncbi:MAG: hypothetical protein ABFD12_03345 [Syntrophorhabdus sp.]